MLIAGRYELVRRIADGGMASVWSAQDTVLERTVVVKVVDLGAAEPTFGERLQREAVATAALSHPDVVTVHDAGVEGSTAYVVMAFVPGRDLGRVVAEGGPLPVAEAVRIGSRVAGALSAAHAAGIVHRDIKPGNVIVDGDRVTVVDFGIASVAGAQLGLTAAGTVIGTAQSMAPEQAEGRPTSPATDVYALGCLLTILLTGAPPFEAETPLAVLRRHVTDAPPSLRAKRPEIPPDLESLVLAMLAKDPAARPNAPAVRDALAPAAATPDASPTVVVPLVAPTQVMPAQPTTAVLPAGVAPASIPPQSSPPPTTAPRRVPTPRQRGVGWMPIAVLALLAVIALAALASTLGDTPGDPGTASVAPSDSTVPEATPTPPPEEPAPTDVAGLLAAIGQDDPDLARDLADRWAAVTEELAKDNADKASERLRDLLNRIDRLEREGRLNTATTDALAAAFVTESGISPADDDRGNGRGNDDDDDD